MKTHDSPIGDAPVMLQLSTYANYALERFDKTICLFKLMENVRLLVEGTITHKLCLAMAPVTFAW